MSKQVGQTELFILGSAIGEKKNEYLNSNHLYSAQKMIWHHIWNMTVMFDAVSEDDFPLTYSKSKVNNSRAAGV